MKMQRSRWKNFFLSGQIQEAEAAIEARSERQKMALQRARETLELADRTFLPLDPLRQGSGIALALELYRQACCWLEIVRGDASLDEPVAISTVLINVEVAVVVEDQANDAVLRSEGVTGSRLVCSALSRNYVADELLDAADLAVQTNVLRNFAHRFAEHQQALERALARHRVTRWRRLLATVSLFLGSILALGFGAARAFETPNLALGKPWRASSIYAPCEPELHRCGGSVTDIFFHTKEEDHPWVEIDLLQSREFRRVEVLNRSDFGQTRAVPLVLEVSDNQQDWIQVARQDEVFNRWKVRFKPQTARYVRLRVMVRSSLHLEKVVVKELRRGSVGVSP